MHAYIHARTLLESSFLPYRCVCLLGVNGTLTVRFHAPQSEDVELVISGIVREDWATTAAVAALVEELRRELEAALSDDS